MLCLKIAKKGEIVVGEYKFAVAHECDDGGVAQEKF
jgi:hypothetical protein